MLLGYIWPITLGPREPLIKSTFVNKFVSQILVNPFLFLLNLFSIKNKKDPLVNPLTPKRTLRSSLEYDLFYKSLCFVQGTRGFGHVQLMNNTLLEMLQRIFTYLKKTSEFYFIFFDFFYDFQNCVILYQFNRAKQLQFSCKLNQLLNNSGIKGLTLLTDDCFRSWET